MINQIGYSITEPQLKHAIAELPNIDFKLTIINQPTGDFFYDPWELKKEYVGTIWEEVYNSLPLSNKGEARLINLAPGTCYWAHSDIDDRWHLSLINDQSFLVDVETQQLYITEIGKWYTMDAGQIHSAVNFGGRNRIQLVVRELLISTKVNNTVQVSIIVPEVNNARYLFDQIFSKWLNRANKAGVLKNFTADKKLVQFMCASDYLQSLLELPHNDFKVILH